MVILQFGFWIKTCKYETVSQILTNDRFRYVENICHLRLTAKQNGSRRLWLQLVRLTVFFTMQTIKRYIIGIHSVGYVLVNMFN